MRTCNACSASLALGGNWLESDARNHHYICRACKSAKQRAYHAEHKERNAARMRENYYKDPEKHRARTWAARVKRLYGLTVEEYNTILDDVCGICGVAKATHLDHDHTTGKVRGGLCHNCNVGLGHFMDDPKRLESALAYLEVAHG